MSELCFRHEYHPEVGRPCIACCYSDNSPFCGCECHQEARDA